MHETAVGAVGEQVAREVVGGMTSPPVVAAVEQPSGAGITEHARAVDPLGRPLDPEPRGVYGRRDLASAPWPTMQLTD